MTVPGDLSAGPASDADGSSLLTSAEVQPLLAAAVEHAGGTLVSLAAAACGQPARLVHHRDVRSRRRLADRAA